MTNPIIQTDIAEVLGQINQKLDNLTGDITDLKDNLTGDITDLKDNLTGDITDLKDNLTGDITDLKVGQAEIKGEIKALDAKVEQMDKRVGNQEFTNRGILIGIIVIILGGAAKLFGFIGNV